MMIFIVWNLTVKDLFHAELDRHRSQVVRQSRSAKKFKTQITHSEKWEQANLPLRRANLHSHPVFAAF